MKLSGQALWHDPTAGKDFSEINIQGTQFGDAADAVFWWC
jgi:hypothetical protein